MRKPKGLAKEIYTQRNLSNCCARIVLGMGSCGSKWFGKIIVSFPCQALRINENVCSPQEGAYRATRHRRYAVRGLSLEEGKGRESPERTVWIRLIPSNVC